MSRGRQRQGDGKTDTNPGRQIHLGSFSTVEAAAKTYDRAAIYLRGQKAHLNFPLEDYLRSDELLLELIFLPKDKFIKSLRARSQVQDGHRTDEASDAQATHAASAVLTLQPPSAEQSSVFNSQLRLPTLTPTRGSQPLPPSATSMAGRGAGDSSFHAPGIMTHLDMPTSIVQPHFSPQGPADVFEGARTDVLGASVHPAASSPHQLIPPGTCVFPGKVVAKCIYESKPVRWLPARQQTPSITPASVTALTSAVQATLLQGQRLMEGTQRSPAAAEGATANWPVPTTIGAAMGNLTGILSRPQSGRDFLSERELTEFDLRQIMNRDDMLRTLGSSADKGASGGPRAVTVRAGGSSLQPLPVAGARYTRSMQRSMAKFLAATKSSSSAAKEAPASQAPARTATPSSSHPHPAAPSPDSAPCTPHQAADPLPAWSAGQHAGLRLTPLSASMPGLEQSGPGIAASAATQQPGCPPSDVTQLEPPPEPSLRLRQSPPPAEGEQTDVEDPQQHGDPGQGGANSPEISTEQLLAGDLLR